MKQKQTGKKKVGKCKSLKNKVTTWFNKKETKIRLIRRTAGALAFLMLAGTVVTAFAAEGQEEEWEYEEITSSGGTSYVKLLKYKGHDTDVVIPDYIGTDPYNNIVVDVGTDVFEGSDGIESLTIGKYMTRGNDRIYDDLKDVKAFYVDPGNNKYYADDGVLYRSGELLAYPKAKTGSYTILDNTTKIGYRAFFETEIDTLTVPETVPISNGLNEDGSKYIYSFLGAEVDSFQLGRDTSGAIIKDNRLIAYGKNSNADLSGVSSANPYAFQKVTQLENSNLPEEVRKTVPFSFYSGEINGLQTRYFHINGKSAYCYNYNLRNPETVGEPTDYDANVSSDEVRRNIKAILFAGYPNDAYGLLRETGVDDDYARNITGTLIWEALNPGLSIPLEDIYGQDAAAAANYRDTLEAKIAAVRDDEMADLTLSFYPAKENGTQGLVEITKISRPVTATVTISKQDITAKEELPGAHLKVTKDDVIIDEWISTDTPHIIENLSDGRYLLTETTAPFGYEIAENIFFTVENGVPSTSDIVMYDQKEVKPSTPSDATPSEPQPSTPSDAEKPKPEKPSRPSHGSGGSSHSSGSRGNGNKHYTTDTTPEVEEPAPTPVPAPETAPQPVERKPVKTGDTTRALELAFLGLGLAGICYCLFDRKKD